MGTSYPLVSRMMSPAWMRLPSSSHTEMAMLPLLSATLQERTSWPSLVLVTLPVSESGGHEEPTRGLTFHTEDHTSTSLISD